MQDGCLSRYTQVPLQGHLMMYGTAKPCIKANTWIGHPIPFQGNMSSQNSIHTGYQIFTTLDFFRFFKMFDFLMSRLMKNKTLIYFD